MKKLNLRNFLTIILIASQIIRSQDLDDNGNFIRPQESIVELKDNERCNLNIQDLNQEQIYYQQNRLIEEQPILQDQQMLNATIYYTKQYKQPDPKNELRIYSNFQLDDQFNKALWNQLCCSSPDLYNYEMDKKDYPGIVFSNVDQNNDINLVTTIKADFTSGLNPRIIPVGRFQPNPSVPILIKKGEQVKFEVQIQCPQNLNYDNYWGAISINFYLSTPKQPNNQLKANNNNQQISQKINAYYFFVCDKTFRPVKYAVSLNLLTLGLSVVVFIMAIYSTPLSITRMCQTRPQSDRSAQSAQSSYSQLTSQKKFERYEIKYYHSSIYALLIVLIAVSNQLMDPKQLEKIMNIIMAVVTSVSTWFFMNEILCHIKPIKRKMNYILIGTKFFNFQVMDVISVIFTSIIEFLWLYFGKMWFFSDLLAIFLLGSLMKLLKFKSLKQAFLFLSICLLVDSVGALIVKWEQSMSYDVLFINQYNEPFLIALPSINKLYDKYCSWLPVTGTAFPGILINYCYRYDKSFVNANTKAFTYLGLFGYVFSSFIYMIIATFNIHSWPYSLINYPLMCLFLFLFAYKRSEHLLLWNGNFYDVIECGQQFVEEEDIKQSHSSEELNRTMYDGLILNSMEFRNTNEQERDSGQSINNEQNE